MSYLSGRHISRDDYYHNANFVVNTEPGEPGMYMKLEEQSEELLLPGDFGGRGIGLAGTGPVGPHAPVPSPTPPPPPPPMPTPDPSASPDPTSIPIPIPGTFDPTPYPALAPTPTLTGTIDDYAAYDPGMAGCTTEQSTCSIPGLPYIGPSAPSPSAHAQPSASGHGPVNGTWISRGYERDIDEYEDDENENPPLASPSSVNGNNNNHAKPSIGSRIVGRVERLAGKVFRDPEIEARGKRHMSGHL